MSRGVLAGIGFVSHDSQTVRVRLKDRVGFGHWIRQRKSCSSLEEMEVRCGWRFPRRVERVLKRTLAGTVAQVLRFVSHPLGTDHQTRHANTRGAGREELLDS